MVFIIFYIVLRLDARSLRDISKECISEPSLIYSGEYHSNGKGCAIFNKSRLLILIFVVIFRIKLI